MSRGSDDPDEIERRVLRILGFASRPLDEQFVLKTYDNHFPGQRDSRTTIRTTLTRLIDKGLITGLLLPEEEDVRGNIIKPAALDFCELTENGRDYIVDTGLL